MARKKAPKRKPQPAAPKRGRTPKPRHPEPARFDKPGRPPFWTDPVKRQAVLDAVALGAPEETAAGVAEMSIDTLIRALNIGADTPDDPSHPDAGYRQFYVDYKKVESQGVVRNLAVVQQAASGERRTCKECRMELPAMVTVRCGQNHANMVPIRHRPEWTAGAWRLERTRPQDFGRRVMVTQGISREELAVNVREMFEDVVREITAAMPDGGPEVAREIWRLWMMRFPSAPEADQPQAGGLRRLAAGEVSATWQPVETT